MSSKFIAYQQNIKDSNAKDLESLKDLLKKRNIKITHIKEKSAQTTRSSSRQTQAVTLAEKEYKCNMPEFESWKDHVAFLVTVCIKTEQKKKAFNTIFINPKTGKL